MFNVIDINKIDHQKINIKKPYIFKKNYNNQEIKTFDLYHENKSILLMTDVLQLYSKNNYCLEFIQNKKKGCLYYLNQLFNYILKRIQSINEYNVLFRDKQFMHILKKQQNCRILTIKDVCNIDTVVFNTNNEVIQIQNIKYQDNVRLILYLKNIWVTPDNIGINLKVSQIQRLEPLLLTKSLFQNNKDGNFKNLNSPPNPPPPPPISLKTRTSHLKEEKDKISLLLYQKNENSEQNFTQTAVRTRPSLSDIIASKNKLRKTNILC